MAAITKKCHTAVNKLLAYQLIIFKASQQYNGLQWQAYNFNFHISAATTGNKRWSHLDTDLYTVFLLGETDRDMSALRHDDALVCWLPKRGNKRESWANIRQCLLSSRRSSGPLTCVLKSTPRAPAALAPVASIGIHAANALGITQRDPVLQNLRPPTRRTR